MFPVSAKQYGPVYDPLTAQFLSPDNYIQSAGDWLNFNRYSYCLNNPFKYTDPSGQAFGVDDAIIILAMAYMGGLQANFFNSNNPFNPVTWNWNNSKTYIGIVSGFMQGAGIAGLKILPSVSGAIPNGLLQAGIQIGFNGVGNLIDKQPFFKDWAGAAAIGFVSGAISGGIHAYNKGAEYNVWWGNKNAYNRGRWSLINTNKPDYYIDFNISNVGSELENDCVPTTSAEIEAKRGGLRSYDDFRKSSNYEEGIGVRTSGNDYENYLMKNIEKLSTKEYHQIFDPDYMRALANKGGGISVHFRGHADNVRRLAVYERMRTLNTLEFRLHKYNFNNSNLRYVLINIFKF